MSVIAVSSSRWNRGVNFTLPQWLQENRERFITFTLDEISDIALATGFTQADIDAWRRSVKHNVRSL